jgi:hypothetical protein
LQVRGIARCTAAVNDEALKIQINADTATNYSWHSLAGNGTAASSGAGATQTFINITNIAGANRTSGIFGSTVFDILDYANTNKFKTTKSIGGYDSNGAGEVWLNSGNWRSTSAITSIKIYFASGNLAQYSSFALYGIKAS